MIHGPYNIKLTVSLSLRKSSSLPGSSRSTCVALLSQYERNKETANGDGGRTVPLFFSQEALFWNTPRIMRRHSIVPCYEGRCISTQ